MLSKGLPQNDPTCDPSPSHDATGYEKSTGTQLKGANVVDMGDDGPDTELTDDAGDPIWWTMWPIDPSLDVARFS